MKAFELIGQINEEGQILLDEPLTLNKPSRAKIIVLISDEDEPENNNDDLIDDVKESLKRALQEVKEGKTRPISELWERIHD
jgi:hypothetical protein